jgi:predicted AAA+ superfamily ATPase
MERSWGQSYFWRTTQQQEVDYLEEQGEALMAVEIKWQENAKARFSKTFTKAYPNATTRVVSPNNYQPFLAKINP